MIDRAIRKILDCSSNQYRKAVYEDSNTLAMAMRGTKLRAIAITKWVISRTMIEILLNLLTRTDISPE